MNTIWKVIPNYEKYEASNTGLIRNVRTKCIITPYTGTKYNRMKELYVRIYDNNNKKHTFSVATLVIYAFHPEIKQKEHFDVRYSDKNYLHVALNNLIVFTSDIGFNPIYDKVVDNIIPCNMQKFYFWIEKDTMEAYPYDYINDYTEELKTQYVNDRMEMLKWYMNDMPVTSSSVSVKDISDLWETACQNKAEKEFKNKYILYNIGVITQNKNNPKLSECVFMVFKNEKFN